MAPIPRLRAHEGPAILSYGFRPFFLLGSLHAGLTVLAWIPIAHGRLSLATAFAPRDWHIHEMLYGFLPAVITGFLLTAIPNWTGRLPLQGRPLLVLVLAWLAGRLAVTVSGAIGWLPALLIDASFLVLVTAAAGREIVAGRNWRNLKVLGILGVLGAGNVLFHLESHLHGTAEFGVRLGLGAAVLLVMLIGGRIIPSFTRNWLARANPGRLPTPHGAYDTASTIAAGASLAAWVVAPESVVAGAALLACGLLQAVRLSRWAGDRALRDPLVLVLHVAYAFVPLGFLLLGAAAFGSVPATAGIHAWAGGALGIMTLAVMSRASLGHTGQALVAGRVVRAVYVLAVLSVTARIGAALHPEAAEPLITLAGLTWAAAFLGFAARFAPLLTRPRRVSSP